MTNLGWVALVGAGPGDPGLITVRGRELLEAADAVVIDRLGTEALVGVCRPDARIIDAGKAPGRQALTQDETNQTLVDLAREGLGVVRLKGGDPFVFGRGGEEAMAVHRRGDPTRDRPGHHERDRCARCRRNPRNPSRGGDVVHGRDRTRGPHQAK